MKNVLKLFVLIAIATVVPAIADSVVNVPFTRLLATPQQYNNKDISVTGVLHKDRNGRWCLYPTLESARIEIDADAFMLMLDKAYADGDFAKHEEEFADKYVLVFGMLDLDPPQPGLYAGIVKNVDQIRTYPLIKPFPKSK